MKQLMDTEEAARILNISIRSIQRWFEAGKIQGEFVDSGKGYGKKGQILKVWISNDDTETRRSGDTEKKEKDHYKVHRGEPGGNVMTDIVNGLPVMEAPPSALLSACTPSGDTTVASGSEEPMARRGPNANFSKLNLPLTGLQGVDIILMQVNPCAWASGWLLVK